MPPRVRRWRRPSVLAALAWALAALPALAQQDGNPDPGFGGDGLVAWPESGTDSFELAAVRDPALVSAAVAAALGLTDVAVSDLPRRLRSASRTEHPTLIVLDNCEQVVEAAPLLGELLASAAWLRLLATSRAPLSLRGERLYVVGPLACDAAVELPSPADLGHGAARGCGGDVGSGDDARADRAGVARRASTCFEDSAGRWQGTRARAA